MKNSGSLYEAKENTRLQVLSAPDIGLLKNLGVRKGTNVVVKNKYFWGGPVLLRINDAYSVAVGKDIATLISVKEYAE